MKDVFIRVNPRTREKLNKVKYEKGYKSADEVINTFLNNEFKPREKKKRGFDIGF